MTTQQKTITHTAFKALPIVDISLLSSENLDDRKQVANDLDKATREAGFLYLKGHPVPNHLIEDLKASVKDYFAQSIDEKMRHYIGLSENSPAGTFKLNWPVNTPSSGASSMPRPLSSNVAICWSSAPKLS